MIMPPQSERHITAGRYRPTCGTPQGASHRVVAAGVPRPAIHASWSRVLEAAPPHSYLAEICAIVTSCHPVSLTQRLKCVKEGNVTCALADDGYGEPALQDWSPRRDLKLGGQPARTGRRWSGRPAGPERTRCPRTTTDANHVPETFVARRSMLSGGAY
jgi:hypothetical protein